MTCDRETIYLYLDGELSPSERGQMWRHLQRCPECAHNLKAQQSLLDELDGLPELPLPARVEQQLIERARQDLSQTFDNPDERRRALLAAGALLGATVILLSLENLTASALRALLGLRPVGPVVWDITRLLLEGVSCVSTAMISNLAEGGSVTLLLAVLITLMMSLALVRLAAQPAIGANKR